MLVTSIFSISNNVVKRLFVSVVVDINRLSLPFPKQKKLDSSKLKKSAQETFKFEENGRVLQEG